MAGNVSSKQLIEAIEGAGYDVRSYSGRAMYGKSCVAFTTDDSMAYAAAQIVGGIEDSEERDEMVSAFRSVRSDSMGLGTVVYFPRFDWPDGATATERDEEEDGE